MDETLMYVIIGFVDIGMIAIIAAIYWLINRKDQVVLMEPLIGGGYRKKTMMRISKDKESVRYKGKSYMLPRGGYLDGSKIIRHIDSVSGKMLGWIGHVESQTISPGELDNYLSGSLIAQIVHALKTAQWREVLVWVLLMAGPTIGFVIGWMLASQPPQTINIIENFQMPVIPQVP